MKNYSIDQIMLKTQKKISNIFSWLPEKFVRKITAICPSNVLLERLTGVNATSWSTYRTTEGNSNCMNGRRFGLLEAYNQYSEEVLKLADELEVPLNHIGYYTKDEIKRRKQPHPIEVLVREAEEVIQNIKPAVMPISERLKNPYSAEEKIKISTAKNENDAYLALGGETSGRSLRAVAQQFYILKKKVDKSITKLVETKRMQTPVVSTPIVKDYSEIEQKMLFAKKLGAKSLTLPDGTKIEF
ncbi:MAG: hypothetical protein ABIP51_05060 [Bacteroidia bacterium]